MECSDFLLYSMLTRYVYVIFVSYGSMFYCKHCKEQLGPSWPRQDAGGWCWSKSMLLTVV